MRFAAIIVLLAGTSMVPLAAQSAPRTEGRYASDNVAHAQARYRVAVRSGDMASAAVAKADLQAFRARAWAIAHPAPLPVSPARR